MLAGFTDPSQLGPALAVAFLTNLYSIVMVAFLFLPVSRFFVTQANTGFDGSLNPHVGVYAQVLSTVVVLIPLGTVYLTFGS